MVSSTNDLLWLLPAELGSFVGQQSYWFFRLDTANVFSRRYSSIKKDSLLNLRITYGIMVSSTNDRLWLLPAELDSFVAQQSY